MQLTEITYSDAKPIDGYGPGFFRVNGQVLHGACLVTPWGAQSWGGPQDLAPLLALVDKVDVLFFGTGAEISHPPAELRRALEGAGVGIEVMASPAACRTYNVLLSEGRRIAVALRPV